MHFYCKDGEYDAYLFAQGTYYKSYDFLGAHQFKNKQGDYTRFTVWAPYAKHVNLIGDFNDWNEFSLPLKKIKDTNLYSICVYGVKNEDAYKYRIVTRDDEIRIKADPYAFYAEVKPNSASKVFDHKNYKWNDKKWMNKRAKLNHKESPISIYEVNLSSWDSNEDGSYLTYQQYAKKLVAYVKRMGYTHIELMPIMEHPFDGSWGYQITGYFAPTSRFGTPFDFKHFVDMCHKNDIGVILDWVPVHFCKDDHGLARFDGSYLFESANQAIAENKGWGTLHFDYSKPEVRSFLISNAIYWLEQYHIDGLRIDAVANMLYLNYDGSGIENQDGSNENVEAIKFIKQLNTVIKEMYPDVLMFAEDSTAWPKVTEAVEHGGLGFDFKWNMGFMHDTLEYMEKDPLFRKGMHNNLTFGITYTYSDDYILPFSHDEVVHGKKSLLDKMPGDYKQKFDNLRLLVLYTYFYPGKKLFFMGYEFGQFIEWNEYKPLDWFLLDYDLHNRMSRFNQDLNKLYKSEKPLYELDHNFEGFNWIEHDNYNESIIAFERIDKSGNKLIGIFNFTPVDRENYKIGVDKLGKYQTVMASGHNRYGGNLKRVKTYKSIKETSHLRDFSIDVNIPGLSGLILKYKED